MAGRRGNVGRSGRLVAGGAVTPNFLSTLARAAILANAFEYELLRPALLEMKNLEPTAFEKGIVHAIHI
jgi:hypothetical protein